MTRDLTLGDVMERLAAFYGSRAL
ncbi:MAG: hypothetical protein QOG64_592, partial [Acidimicrobiaceae bacterium]|nr:hypothetical protein [Acidimicrobiaceae bacterium]